LLVGAQTLSKNRLAEPESFPPLRQQPDQLPVSVVLKSFGHATSLEAAALGVIAKYTKSV
jgi:hypothetical protein